MKHKIAIINPGVLFNHILTEGKIEGFDNCLLIYTDNLFGFDYNNLKEIKNVYIDDYGVPFNDQIVLLNKLFPINIRFKSLTDLFEEYYERAALFYYDGVLHCPQYLHELKENIYFNSIFRFFDIFFVILISIFSIWIIIIAGLLLLVFSGTPLFFTQKRVGKNGKTFIIYKLRTMINGESKAHTTLNDSRIFPLGMFYRKFKIDELPQLINILLGHMSFFGPRPERLDLHIEICDRIPFFQKRLIVRPGLTGWAQIKNPKATPDESFEKLQYDIFFIKNISLKMVFKIVFKTIEILIKKNSN